MPLTDTDNNIFKLAAGFVNNSNRHIFLTGKAGTGKTTFLKYIQQHTFKKAAVVAPTGVAAINAGGVTMHSFFQLPFGPFVPMQSAGWNSNAIDANTLFKNIRFNKSKRDLLRELELLIIDEVSMVRADMLDATDAICRHFRRRPYEPFGGLQVLYIGDLFQLPPVVNDEEWQNILAPHYKSPFFFDAQVMNQMQPLVIELKKIYRQDDTAFIDILNNIRNNEATEADLDKLHDNFDRSFEPSYGEQYIVLTTHNSKADAINQQELKKLKGKVYSFKAEINGDFNEKSFPADKELQLKIGAQVMFVKNDKGDFRRYYNGKLAVVSRIDDDGIFVTTDDNPDELEVEMEEWKNIRYNYNHEKDKVDEEELGVFHQYPLRLAWAITIHKSQGLTFEKAIIDAGSSFAAGQVYVALSRMTSLKGMVLFSRIHPNAIKTDERVIEFVQNEMDEDEMGKVLEEEQRNYVGQSLIDFFNWDKLYENLETLYNEYEDRLIPDKEAAKRWAAGITESIKKQKDVAAKFSQQLQQIVKAESPDYQHLQSRTEAAASYFKEELKKVLSSLQEHIDEVKIKKRVKKYVDELVAIKIVLQRKEYQIDQSAKLAGALAKGTDTSGLLDIIEEQKKTPAVIAIAPDEKRVSSGKAPKGESQRISLAMFKEGKSVLEIAKERGFAASTIEGHLVAYIETGEVKLTDLLSEEKINHIKKVMEELGDTITGSKDIKDKLPVEYSYSDIKAVMVGMKTEK